MGLKDQSMALRWVNENIVYFGNVPDRITLMGQSSGESSSHLHMLSPMSKGLFDRAISESGNALNYFGFTKDPRPQALHLGRSMNCPTNSSREMVACMKKKPALELNLANNLEMYCPSPETIKDKLYIFDEPLKLIMGGKVTIVPWIVGANKNDGLLIIILRFLT